MPTKVDRDLLKIETGIDELRESKFGIYAYRRKSDNKIIYIGKDSNIVKKVRYYDHLAPSKRKEQRINSYLQSTAAKGLEYIILAIAADLETMNNLETMYIMTCKSIGECKFNTAIDINETARENIIEYLSDPELKIN